MRPWDIDDEALGVPNLPNHAGDTAWHDTTRQGSSSQHTNMAAPLQGRTKLYQDHCEVVARLAAGKPACLTLTQGWLAEGPTWDVTGNRAMVAEGPAREQLVLLGCELHIVQNQCL